MRDREKNITGIKTVKYMKKVPPVYIYMYASMCVCVCVDTHETVT